MNDYRVFFGADNPQLVAFENLQYTYAKNDNVMMVLAPGDGNVFSKYSLQALAWLAQRVWQAPYSSRVDSITYFQQSYAEGDDLILEDLVPDSTLFNAADLQRIKRIVLGEPALINRLVSPGAHVTGVNISIQLPGIDEMIETPEVATFVRSLRAEFLRIYPDLEVKLTGIIMINNILSEATIYDISTLFPVEPADEAIR